MIRLEQVHRAFGAVHAVRGIDLDIPRGQVAGILGPNGAGKTTTIRMITGVIPPSGGRVLVDGLDTVSDTIAVRRRIGYLPESAPLYREMRVADYLRYRGRLYGLERRARERAIARSLDRCGLGEVRRRRIGHLSKGYRQRVGLASVLLHDPPLLILDEPTNGLDPVQIAEMRALIRELAGDRTMLLVSHILPEVERVCDRIILFARGSIQADGDPAALVRDLPGAGRYTLEARGEPPGGTSVRDVVQRVTGIESVDDEPLDDGWTRVVVGFAPDSADRREDLARACAGAGLIVRELRAQTRSLEDVYLRLVAYTEPPAPSTTTPRAAS
ncbi:MAG TPA: MFS transporter [Phycisphaerales bacterium]|nr:MFS transporter [Phycisphaerales bacterium]